MAKRNALREITDVQVECRGMLRHAWEEVPLHFLRRELSPGKRIYTSKQVQRHGLRCMRGCGVEAVRLVNHRTGKTESIQYDRPPNYAIIRSAKPRDFTIEYFARGLDQRAAKNGKVVPIGRGRAG
jgi:hypothetical protein